LARGATLAALSFFCVAAVSALGKAAGQFTSTAVVVLFQNLICLVFAIPLAIPFTRSRDRTSRRGNSLPAIDNRPLLGQQVTHSGPTTTPHQSRGKPSRRHRGSVRTGRASRAAHLTFDSEPERFEVTLDRAMKACLPSDRIESLLAWHDFTNA
jgi:hypothetical protein